MTVTVADHGRDLNNGEQFLDGFVSTHPETGPVVDQNTETGHLSITYSFDADELRDAWQLGGQIFVDGANASGLEPTDFIGSRLDPVGADELIDDRELQPA
jgi:hypothetical protein